MSLVIDLTPDTEERLAEQAQARGMPLAEYVKLVLEQQLRVPRPSKLSPAERAAAWIESSGKLPHTEPLSDEAISRETIYSERG